MAQIEIKGWILIMKNENYWSEVQKKTHINDDKKTDLGMEISELARIQFFF